MPNEDEIRVLAYSLWEEEGHLDGKDVEYYFRAKKILEEGEAKRILELAPVQPSVELMQPPKNISLPTGSGQRSIRSRHKKK